MSRQDEEVENLPPIGERFCECGQPEPCSRRACLEALSARADYWEAEAYPAGEEGAPRSGKVA